MPMLDPKGTILKWVWEHDEEIANWQYTVYILDANYDPSVVVVLTGTVEGGPDAGSTAVTDLQGAWDIRYP